MLSIVLRNEVNLVGAILSLDAHDVAVEFFVCSQSCADISNYELQQGFYSILTDCGGMPKFLGLKLIKIQNL
jgi:hypothetical protein